MIDVTASVTGSVKARSKKEEEKEERHSVPSTSSFVVVFFEVKMDSRIGLDYIVENSEYTSKLGSG